MLNLTSFYAVTTSWIAMFTHNIFTHKSHHYIEDSYCWEILEGWFITFSVYLDCFVIMGSSQGKKKKIRDTHLFAL